MFHTRFFLTLTLPFVAGLSVCSCAPTIQHDTGATQQNPAAPRHPDAIICAVPVRGLPAGTIIAVPLEQKSTDFCPEQFITKGIYYYSRDDAYGHVPKFNDIPPPTVGEP